MLDKVKLKTINNNSLIGDGNISVGGSDIVTSWEDTLSDTKVPSEKLTKNSLDAKADSSSLAAVATSGSYADLSNKPTIPSDVSDLTDTQNTAFTPKSHSHGNLSSDGKLGSNANYIVVTTTGGAITSVQKLGNITYDGKIGSNANYFVYTTTSGQVTSKQKIGNITTSGAIGSTSGLPIITATSGVLTTGSFGTGSGTFAEGNHTHSNYISTSSTTGLVKNDGSVDTNTYLTSSAISGMLTTSDIANNLTTTASGKVLDARQGKVLADLIGDAITYINQ